MPKAARRQTSSHPGLSLVLGAGLSFPCSAGADDGLPTRIKIAAWGENEARTQGVKFRVGATSLQRLQDEQSKRAWDTVSMDYDHQSVPGHQNFKPDPRELAAHGRIEVVQDQGIFYRVDKYTPSGKRHAASYPDVSGFFILDPKTREVIAVHSVALTQHGDVQGATFDEALAATAINASGGYTADETTEQVLDHCRELLGFDSESLPADIAAGLSELIRAKNTVPKSNTKTAMQTDQEKLAAAIASTAELKDLVTSLATSVKTLNNTIQTGQHNAAVEAEFTIAASAGKKIPDSLRTKDAAGQYVITSSTAKDVLAAIPATEAVEFNTPEFIAANAGRFSMGTTEGAEAQVAIALGIKPEDLKKDLIVHGNAPLKGTEHKFLGK